MEQDSMSTSSDALADALSSSLASIVASRSSSTRRDDNNNDTSDAMHLDRRTRQHGFNDDGSPPNKKSDNDDEARSNHSTSDGGGHDSGGASSSWSRSTASTSHFPGTVTDELGTHRAPRLTASGRGGSGDGGAEEGDAALVSNTTGSSGGDDRDSSASGRGSSGGGASNNNKDSSSSDSGGDRASSSAGGDKGHASLPSHDHTFGASRGHQHPHAALPQHHHQFHHHHPAHHPHPSSLANASSSDGYGLPVPKDDRFSAGQNDRAQHASVVAHRLPPPKSSGSGSSSSDAAANNGGSGGDSDRDQSKGGGLHVHRHQQGESRYEPGALLQPLREPGFHTIRRTFHRVSSRRGGASAEATARKRSAETDSSEEVVVGPPHHHHHKHKSGAKRAAGAATSASTKTLGPAASARLSSSDAHVLESAKKESKKRKLPRPGRGSDNDESGGSGSSSDGGGTEGGYAGSASSNGNGSARGTGSCSSPSVSSSEDSVGKQHKRSKTSHALYSSTLNPSRPLLSRKRESSLSMSSDIADFSSGSDDGADGVRRGSFAAAFSQSSRSPSITSSDDQGETSQPRGEDRTVSRKLKASAGTDKKRDAPGWPAARSQQVLPAQAPGDGVLATSHSSKKNRRLSLAPSRGTGNLKSDFPTLDGKPPILAVGCDVMAHVLTFLEPPEVLDVLTMPLSKDWLTGFTRQPELWRVLCLLDPFKAQVEYHEPGGSSSSSSASSSTNSSSDMSVDSFREESDLRQSVGAFRLLYTSFVRCLRYLSRIKDDAMNGRPPSVIDYGARPMAPNRSIRGNENLHHFLAQARGVVLRDRVGDGGNDGAAGIDNSDISDDDNNSGEPRAGRAAAAAAAAVEAAIGVSDDGSAASLPRGCSDGEASGKGGALTACKRKKRVKYGHSMLTQRLLGPSADGTPGNSDLPWSCAIYSIVNWMVAFSDVEGIQTMCLKVLPFILEDEQQRMTAQRAGLTDIVLRGMVMFPDSTILHTAAFHTLVLLARPLGGREGMLFHSSMVNSSGIFSAENGSSDGRNGIAVMLDSMRRFQYNEVLQAMSCWSLVNIALAPSQKEMLVKLGGIEVTVNAMTLHPYSAEVNFRGLFALINLVIPSVSVNENQEGGAEAGAGGAAAAVAAAAAIVPVEDTSEREMLDEMVDQLVNLVVLAMKNFCASEAILNRACLVLHNLSLTQDYHEPLLFTPNCYQMLEWCLANYPTDQVLQQSAAGTLHRLQITLSNDAALRNRFATTLQQQQRESLEQAHQEAVRLSQQHDQHVQQQPLDAAP